LSEIIENIFIQFLKEHSNEEVTLENAVEKIGTGADAIQRAPIVDYDTGIRCIRVGDMTNSRNRYEWGFTEMTEKDFENYKLEVGDIVITRTAANGIAYMIEDDMKVVCNNGLIKMKVNNKYNPLFIYLYLKTKDFYNYVHRIDSETSVRQNMKVNYLTSYKIMNISKVEQDELCEKLLPLRKRQKEIIEENNTLSQLRDTLLPKLMNGEIDLDNIEI
jgi:type I restriction enzyme S subunit